MKKIITLLITAGAFIAVHAQTSKDEARKVILGTPKGSPTSSPSQNGRDIILGGGNGTTYPNSNPNNYPNSSREARIAQINREYDQKIYSIRNNPKLSAAEKERIIRQLEADRARRIKEINDSYSKHYHKKKHKDDDDHDHDKHDNGKHLGWEKGKGNPHKGKEKEGRDDD
jgi:hypothetical protein